MHCSREFNFTNRTFRICASCRMSSQRHLPAAKRRNKRKMYNFLVEVMKWVESGRASHSANSIAQDGRILTSNSISAILRLMINVPCLQPSNGLAAGIEKASIVSTYLNLTEFLKFASKIFFIWATYKTELDAGSIICPRISAYTQRQFTNWPWKAGKMTG